jgi:hypothetical protein
MVIFFFQFNFTHTERNLEATSDMKVEIEGWLPNERDPELFTRTIHFDTPINAPAMIVSVMRLGSSVKCRLDDELHWVDVDSEFKVHSKLSFLNVPAINQDTVKVDINYKAIRVTPTRTHMILSISCEFTTRIWGLTGIVENFMEKDAQSSFEQWLDLAEQHLREYQQKMRDVEEEEREEEEEELSAPSIISSTSYQSVQDTTESHEEEEEQEEKSISQLLQRSYTLASLKRDLREVRALVSKTEVRVMNLEAECSNNQLDLTVNRYLQRVEQLFNQQVVERDQARERLSSTQSYIEAVLAKYRRSSALWWFFSGSAITFLFTVVLPFTAWYFHSAPKRKR